MAIIQSLSELSRNKPTPKQILNFLNYYFSNKGETVSWQPIFLSIFLTYRCNLHCDMCLTHSHKFSNRFGQQPARDMEFSLFEDILNRYNKALIVFLIGNGEPLLHKDLFKMINYAADVMKMQVYSSTNGTLLGNYIDQIINSRLNHLYISINGYDSKEYNRMTGMPPHLFESICNNTRKLIEKKNEKQSKLKITGTFILDIENYDRIKDMIYLAKCMGLKRVNFFQFLPVNSDGFRAEERCLFSDNLDVAKSLEEALSLVSDRNMQMTISLPPLLDRDLINNKYCSVPFTHLCVDGEGHVGGCSCQLLNLNNGGNFSNKNVWNDFYFQELRKRFLDPDLLLMETCNRCYNNSTQKKGLWHKRN